MISKGLGLGPSRALTGSGNCLRISPAAVPTEGQMTPSSLQIVLLGLVQGLAEPLPVSSSAHVIAAEKLMGIDPSSPQMTFMLIMLHTGSLGAVIVYFWAAWRR